MNSSVSLKELLEAGCHFGHQSQRWNPKAASYIYTERDNIHIIDLAKTRDGITSAVSYLSDLISKGGNVLFLGTKRQAREIIKKEAQRAGVYYISERWPAGLLTNFEVIKKNLQKMRDIKDRLVSEEVKASYTKREIGLWEKELIKLEMVYGGIAEMREIPQAMFVIDVKKEAGAIREAIRRGVTVIGVVDTNSDPDPIDYPIPANDDAVGSITIVTKYITDAAEEAMKIREKRKVDELKTQSSLTLHSGQAKLNNEVSAKPDVKVIPTKTEVEKQDKKEEKKKMVKKVKGKK